MKRLIILFILISLSALPVWSAGFSPYFAGLKQEVNKNSYNKAAVGIGLENSYSITDEILIGTEILFSTDFTDFNSLSLTLNNGCRFNPLDKKQSFIPYAGTLFGYQQILYKEEVKHIFTAGLEGRMIIKTISAGKNKLTFQPYIKIGYPFIWAAGIGAGVCF